jgi:hypothetical protein
MTEEAAFDSLDQEQAGRREDVVAAVGSSGRSDNIDSRVNERLEQRDYANRVRDRERPLDRHQHEGDRSARLRAQIRGATRQEEHKAAQRNDSVAKPTPATAGQPTHTGPNPAWSANAKGEWSNIPESVRAQLYRDQQAYTPRLAEHAAILDSVKHLAPVFQQEGITAVEGIKRMVGVEAGLRNPQTTMQTLHTLARAYGVDLNQYQYQQSDPHVTAQLEAHFNQFKTSRPHFDSVRVGMGTLIANNPADYVTADGQVNLDKAYSDACRHLGLAGATQTSPPPARRTQMPAVKSNGSTGSLRGDIIAALNGRAA